MEQEGGGVGRELWGNRHQGVGQALGWDGGVELGGPVQRCFADRILQLQGGEQLPAVGGMEIEPQRPALQPLLWTAGRWQVAAGPVVSTLRRAVPPPGPGLLAAVAPADVATP
jgi:hypothetical protein